ncbi:hypothetical protein Taro_035814 [Colocasia esculenta]|uniref:Uncharacterized protein n=1 Tax=Colocasia esculenta TaxID=4460 RepID=A0A843WJR8_COLES|nr:hypothetical protein [Colocasia esculenta]
MVTSPVGCPRFSVSEAVSSGLCPGTCVVPSSTLLVGGTDTSCRHWSPTSPFPVSHSSEPSPGSLEVPGMGLRPCGLQVVYLCLVCSVLGEFPTEPVTSEAHPYSPQAGARRWFLYRRPVQSRDVVCVVSLVRLRPVRGRQTRVRHVTCLTGLDEAFRHSWYQSKAVVMADRRDWGGGGDDPEESTQRMIERIWESLTDIRMRMDRQAPVPPVIGEAVPVAPVPPQPRVEVPFVAPVPPSPPVIAAEEPVVQVERFLRLQPPTYTGGPNLDTTEHWIHEVERVFMTMRCPTVDRVLLATYQLRGFAQE